MSAHLLGDMSSLLFEVPRRSSSSSLGPFGGTSKAIISAVLTSEELPSACSLSSKSKPIYRLNILPSAAVIATKSMEAIEEE